MVPHHFALPAIVGRHSDDRVRAVLRWAGKVLLAFLVTRPVASQEFPATNGPFPAVGGEAPFAAPMGSTWNGASTADVTGTAPVGTPGLPSYAPPNDFSYGYPPAGIEVGPGGEGFGAAFGPQEPYGSAVPYGSIAPYGEIVPAPSYPGIGEPRLDPPLDPRTLERMAEIATPDPYSLEAPFFYRASTSAWRFVTRGQAGFADTSWENDPYIDPTRYGGVGMGAAVRWLEGPLKPDLNPRLYDLQFAYQHRAMLLNGWSFDLAGTVGFFTDFEGSVTDGIRFPGHAVLSGPVTSRLRWVAGGEYLDRDDFAWLPVGGFRWEPRPDLQIHAEFPRPMIRWLNGDRALYLRGELGGGTWDVRTQVGADDVVTYRELALWLGSETAGASGRHAIEIGYLTGRRLEYRAFASPYELPDSWVFRIVDRF
ncbi:MAG TPA: hypothetical protein PLI18_00150 [Pirellulaceae bacterium]|nr:hypothetical protein [Pirellulaceae bacterium]